MFDCCGRRKGNPHDWEDPCRDDRYNPIASQRFHERVHKIRVEMGSSYASWVTREKKGRHHILWLASTRSVWPVRIQPYQREGRMIREGKPNVEKSPEEALHEIDLGGDEVTATVQDGTFEIQMKRRVPARILPP